MTATTHTQNYTISGFGAWYSPVNKKGALSVENNVTLSGGITVAGDAMMTATNGYTATLTGAISGQGDLYLGTALRQGSFVLSGGIDLAGDLHIDTCVTNSGAIDLGGRFIYLNGTLVFNNTSDITVDAKVIGKGRIVLAGSGKVDIADLSVFDGVVDIDGNEDAALGALFGAVAVTNSAATVGALAVTGESDYGYFGQMSDVMRLSVSGSLVLPVGTDYTENLQLALAGGSVDLLGPTVFAALSGDRPRGDDVYLTISAELSDYIVDLKIPMEQVIEEKNGKKKVVERKLLPCYVFIKMIYTNQIWYYVTSTRGVTGFCGPQGRPIPMKPEEIRKMRLETLPVATDFVVGDTVSIEDGPLKGFVGEVKEVNQAAQKAKISTVMFGRNTDVEVEFSQIEKVDAAAVQTEQTEE
jgi:transcriptional antiterminator NusG